MQKIIDFLNRYSIVINSVSIIFWLYIIYNYYRATANSSEGKGYFYIIPVLFIVLSVFNIIMFLKRKNKD